MPPTLSEVRYASRMLRKSGSFTWIAVLTLALGIGANTAIFSVIQAVLLRGLPYPDPDRLVLVWGNTPSRGMERGQVSFTDAADWRRQTKVFEELGAFGQWNATLSGEGPAERVPAVQVSDGFFQTLRAHPYLGRLFLPEDQIDGRDFVVVLSNEIWRGRFGADPKIVGSQIRINAGKYTVVGVLPPDFRPLPESVVNGVTQIYRPSAEPIEDSLRGNRHFRAIGRLRPDVTLERAQSELSTFAAAVERANPNTNTGYGVRLISLREDLVREVRSALFVLYGAVVFVLLIACTNVANLLLGRFSARRKELAIRLALGASKQQIFREVITESLLLSVLGSVAGLLIASWLLTLLEKLGNKVLPGVEAVSINAPVLLFTALLAVITGLVFGLFPAIQAARTNINQSLKDGAGMLAGGPSRLRQALVISEVTLALVLLCGAGLLIRSIRALYQVDPGFKTENVLAADIALPYAKYGRTPATVRFYHQLVDKLSALPGVESVGATSTLPMADFDTVTITVEDHPVPQGERPNVDRYIVTSQYASTMKIPLLSGRLITQQDTETSPPVILVNETAARRLWPGEDAIGKRIMLPSDKEEPWRAVAGIVQDVKQYALDKSNTMQIYIPDTQDPANYMTMVMRAKGDPTNLINTMREQLKQLDSDAVMFHTTTLDRVLADTFARRKLLMDLLAAFATVALLLAAVGIYGVYSFIVMQRQREIAIRMSLGAQRGDVMRMVMGQSFRTVAIGTVLGILTTLLVSRLLTTFLFGVQRQDPVTFVAVAGLLWLVAMLASYLPGRRAALMDPMAVLRSE